MKNVQERNLVNEHICKKTGKPKQVFESIRSARSFIKRLSRPEDYQAYYCEMCGKFHIGHKTDKDKIKELKARVLRLEGLLEKKNQPLSELQRVIDGLREDKKALLEDLENSKNQILRLSADLKSAKKSRDLAWSKYFQTNENLENSK